MSECACERVSVCVGACVCTRVWQAACLTSQIMDIIHTVSAWPGGRGELRGAEEERRRNEGGGWREVTERRGEPLLQHTSVPILPLDQEHNDQYKSKSLEWFF